MSDLTLHQVSHSYGAKNVINNLSLSLLEGQIGCLLGPSGCGKTTVLRAIAGFETISSGQISIGGEIVSQANQLTPPEKRKIGMVFQDYALFPHLTVAKNIGFGIAHLSTAQKHQRIEELLCLTGLENVANKFPYQLSGGQQQRVALARALAPKPRLLLMDEPFSNLDVELRERLSIEVRDILKQEGTTVLIVTHDQHEAFAIADMVGVMHQGHIQQWTTPYELYHKPQTRFIANFIGQGVFLPGTVLNSTTVEIELGILKGDLPTECEPYSCANCKNSCHVDVLIRPDDIIHDDTSSTLAEVESKIFRGAEFLYTLKLPSGRKALSLVPSHHNHEIGEFIGIKLAIDHVVAYTSFP